MTQTNFLEEKNMAEARKAQAQKQKTWKATSKGEREEIVRLYNTGKYTQEQIADITHRGSGTISNVLKKVKGLPKKNLILNVEPVKKADAQKKDNKTGSSVISKEYKPSEREKNLHPDVIKLLQTSKSHDEFVQGYYKKFGFNSGVGIHILIGMWTHRAAIFKFEKEKEEQKNAIVIKIPVITEPIKKEKPDSLPDVGEQLAKINNNIVEMIFITKDLLQVQKDTYTLFKGKIGSVKNNDVGVGDPTIRMDK